MTRVWAEDRTSRKHKLWHLFDLVYLRLRQGLVRQSHQPNLLQHSRHAFNRVRRPQFIGRRDLELAQTTGADKDARLERTRGFVVGLHGAVEALPDLVETIRERGQALVELLSETGDFAIVLGQRFLSPRMRDGSQQRDQC